MRQITCKRSAHTGFGKHQSGSIVGKPVCEVLLFVATYDHLAIAGIVIRVISTSIAISECEIKGRFDLPVFTNCEPSSKPAVRIHQGSVATGQIYRYGIRVVSIDPRGRKAGIRHPATVRLKWRQIVFFWVVVDFVQIAGSQKTVVSYCTPSWCNTGIVNILITAGGTGCILSINRCLAKEIVWHVAPPHGPGIIQNKQHICFNRATRKQGLLSKVNLSVARYRHTQQHTRGQMKQFRFS